MQEQHPKEMDQTPTMMNRILATILCTLLTLTACSSSDPGSGGGIGGTGITPINATGATLGSISGFGSIIVNGTRFNTDNATIFVNDMLVSQADLRLGMNVLVDVNFSSSVAEQVRYVPSLIALVESINLENRSFQSLGQTVQLVAGTSFENLSLAEMAVGMVVEVSGLRDANGVIVATFIRPALDTTRFQLVGTILSDLGTSQVFSLNGLQVSLAQADLSNISTDDLEFGDKVYVTADSDGYDVTSALLSADSIHVALEPMVTAGQRVEYEGIVSTITSTFEFDVYWQPVVITDQTRVEYEDGTLADMSMIMLNSRVEIEAAVREDGVYLASKVILIATENSEITGSIESINLDTASFNVLGLDIQVTDRTVFDGSSDTNGDRDITSFNELSVGDYVEVDAAFLGTRLIANGVELDDQDERAIIKGPVSALNMAPDNISIINQTIVLGPDTEFENGNDVEISRDAFIDLLQVGVIVKARWDVFQSVALPPDSIELE